MPRKFKVGDLVRVTEDTNLFVAAGKEARIIEVEPDDYEGGLVYLLQEYPYDVWVHEEGLELVESATPEVTSTSQLAEDERFFAYSLIQNGHDVERVLDIIRTLRKGV